MAPMVAASVIVAERRSLLAVTESLVREFHPDLSAGQVIATVRRCRDTLASGGARSGLAEATCQLARTQLRASVGPSWP